MPLMHVRFKKFVESITKSLSLIPSGVISEYVNLWLGSGLLLPLGRSREQHRGVADTGTSIMAVATIEADKAVASSVFVQTMGTPLKKLLVRVILVIFGHFTSSDFKVWLQ